MILVTGATGFIGHVLVKLLESQGKRVRALIHRTNLAFPIGTEVIQGDLRDRSSLRRACSGVNQVVHLAGIIQEKGASSFEGINHQGTRALLQAAEEMKVARYVHVSPLGTGPDKRYPFLYSRWLAEQSVWESKIPSTIIRPSIVFGPQDDITNRLATIVRWFPLIPILPTGKARFQPIAVEDVVQCLSDTLELPDLVGRALDIGGPSYTTYEELVDMIVPTLEVSRIKIRVPLPLLYPATWIMEKIFSKPLVTSQQLAMLSLDSTTQLDSVIKFFGFAPRPMTGNLGYLRDRKRKPHKEP